MGNVYKARQISRNRDVALKVLFRHLADQPALLQRFHREAELMTRLDHPHLLRGYEVGEDQGWHYLAMECVEGGSLQVWLGQLGKFPIADAVHVALACARALQYAHDRNLVHRDVKPDNILLSARGVVKVADLGLAKAQDDLSVTRTGTAAGTPLYMAPEQAVDAKRVDGRSDLYSLGCVFYTLLTGRPPFRGTSVVDLIQAKERGAFPAARRFTPQVPERLELVLDRMLARAPEQRYQTAAELAEDLEGQALAGDRLSFFPARGTRPATPGG
jgi:serine/threonine-protein kinase